MPKKHYKSTAPKPKQTVHPSLGSFTSSDAQHDSGSSNKERSVTELIQHLRRTQVAANQYAENTAVSSGISPRSVHPSIRNILELPETPPPRARPGTRSLGAHRLRRAAGPPPPLSWLSPTPPTTGGFQAESGTALGLGLRKAILRLAQLPGIEFPAENTLLHATLKSIAVKWDWHLVYDGVFLSELPNRVKQLLLSYVAVYTDHASMGFRMQGLKPLFMDDSQYGQTGSNSDITRLDLSSAVGRWIGLKQLTRELKYSDRSEVQAQNEDATWEEEADSLSTAILTTSHYPLRFQNLRFLSLAHPDPDSANWMLLLNLLTQISTLTHLCLAHWPIPTLTPHAVHARMRHPKHTSLSFSYGGTDTYSAYENNWAEASGILRRLSKATYCLKWLDLEGCSDWFPALTWDDTNSHSTHPISGPEWNGSWRGLEWLGLGAGWFPDLSKEDVYLLYESDTLARRHEVMEAFLAPPQPTAIDTLFRNRLQQLSGSAGRSTGNSDAQNWDDEAMWEKYRHRKERDAYRKVLEKALNVKKRIQTIRFDGGGKWLDISLGPESEEERGRICGIK